VNIDLEQIKLLLDMVSKTEVSELTIEIEDERITIKKPHPGQPCPPQPNAEAHGEHPSHADKPTHVFHAPAHAPAAPSKEHKDGGGGQEHLVAITAPMVGTFYRASSPTTPPFVEVGDKITVGQTVCIIEAMKLMNDLPSEVAGKVVKICAENGSTVEFGQQLYLVDPKA